MKFTTHLAQYKILLILAALDERPKSARELADELHIDRSLVPQYLKHMGARVAAWVRPGTGNLVPYYDMKRCQPAQRPAPLTETQRKRARWKRIKADPVRHARVKALQRANRSNRRGAMTVVIDGITQRV